MSRFAVVAAAAAAAAVAASSALAASDTATLNVSATVTGVCKLTLSGPMAFGLMDPSSTSDQTKQVIVTYKCSKGLPVTSFTVEGGTSGTFAAAMKGTAPGNLDTIPYTITWTNPAAYTGEGLGPSITGRQVTLQGIVLNANYVNKNPDLYNHSVGLAVNY